jgi:hypothetical protein
MKPPARKRMPMSPNRRIILRRNSGNVLLKARKISAAFHYLDGKPIRPIIGHMPESPGNDPGLVPPLDYSTHRKRPDY